MQTIDVNISGDIIPSGKCAKYLGVEVDEQLNFKHQIRSVCKKAMFNLLRIRNIRNMLNRTALIQVVLGLVISYLDYSSNIFIDLPEVDIVKLQRIKIFAAKLILGRSKYDAITDWLISLHWLPIRMKIKFYVLCMVYKCLNDIGPQYLKDILVELPIKRENLRSNNNYRGLLVPRTKSKTFGSQSFSVRGS